MPTKTKKAFLLIYEQVDDAFLKVISESKKHKLEAAGFEVVELSVTADDLSSNEATQKKVINEIIKASEAEKGEFHLINHGGISADASGPKCTGQYMAECLLKAGMGKITDLNGLRIRYVACFGDLNENAHSLFKTLHEGGAGHFVGDALDSERAIILEDFDFNIKSSNKYLEEVKSNDGSNDIDILNTKVQINNFKARKGGEIKRGDSFANIPPDRVSEHPLAYKLPFKEKELELSVPTHAADKNGKYIHTRYFLAPIKSAKSKISITRNPKEVKKFQRANVKGSKPKVTQTTNVKPGETSGISSDRYAPEDMPTNQTPQVKQKIKNRLKNRLKNKMGLSR